MRLFVLICLFALPLTACKTTAQDGDRRISVEDGYHKDAPHDGKFCPPGHAKKGWC